MITVEDIRDRIQSLAEETYNRKDEPITEKMSEMMDWMAEEFALVHHEVNQTQDYIISQVSQSKDPHFAHRTIPDHELHFMFPDKISITLNPEDEAVHHKEEYRDGKQVRLAYTPLQRYRLDSSYPKYKLYNGVLSLFDRETNLQERTTLPNVPSHPAIIWWGFKVEDIPSENPINLYFDTSEVKLEHLDLITWTSAEGKKIEVDTGLYVMPMHKRYPEFHLDHEKLFNYHLVNCIKEKYGHKYVHFVLPNSYVLPAELSGYYSEDLNFGLHQVEEKIVWIRSNMPANFQDIDLESLMIRTNIFPICNRRLSKEISVRAIKNDLLYFNINEKLNPDDQYISLETVFGRSGNYHPVRIGDKSNPSPGMYGLKQVPNDSSQRNFIKRRIYELRQILKRNVHVFNEKKTDEVLNHLTSALGILESDFLLEKPQASYQLIIRPRKENEEIMIRCWVNER